MVRARRPALRFVVTAVVLAAAWVLVMQGVDEAAEDAEDDRARDRLGAAAAAASVIDGWLEDAGAQATRLARSLEPWAGSPRQIGGARAALDAGTAVGTAFDDGAFVLDGRRRVVATTASRAALVGQGRDGPAVDAALAGTLAVSDVAEDPLERDLGPGVLVVAPLRDGGGAVTGAVAGRAGVPDGSLGRAVARVPQVAGLRTLVATAGGSGASATVLNASPLRPTGAELAEPLRQARAEPVLVRYRGEAGAATVAAVGPAGLGHQRWAVVAVTEPAADFDRPLRSPVRAAGIGLGLLLAGVLVALTATDLRRRAAAASAERAKHAFLSIAGHELRTPLTVIKGFSQTLARRWDSLPEDSRRDMLANIARHARTLEHLVERLLAGARLQAGVESTLRLRPTPVRDVLEDLVHHHQALAPLHELVLEGADDDLTAQANPGALRQVLDHLVDNAIKYSPAGGVVQITAHGDGRRVAIAVEDEGVGLPTDAEAIFELFGQGEDVDTRTHDEGGVGIGLYIARSLVEQMGGTIRAEPRSPKGARFVVELAAIPAESDTSPAG